MTVEAGNSKTLYLEDLKQYAIRDPEAIEAGGDLVRVHLPELRNPSWEIFKQYVFADELIGVRLIREKGNLFVKAVGNHSSLERSYYATDMGLVPYNKTSDNGGDYYNPSNFLVNVKKLEAEGYTVVLEASEKFKKSLEKYNELVIEEHSDSYAYWNDEDDD